MSMDDTLWQEFAAESEEHLDTIERRLTSGPVLDRPGIDALFRAFHSVKGMSDALGAGGMKQLSHRCEDLLGAARAARASISGVVVDALLAAVDGLRTLRAQMLDAQHDGTPDAALLAQLAMLAEGGAVSAGPARKPTVRDGGADAALLGALASRLADAAPQLARLRQHADAVAVAEAQSIATSCDLLRLPRLAATLRRLAGLSGTAALPVLGQLRRQVQLVAERSGEDAGAALLCAMPEGEAEKAMRPALAGLAVRLEAVVAGSSADAPAAVAEARDAAAIAAALGLDHAEAVLLRIEELVDRASEPEAAEILARQGPTLAEQLRLAAETGVLGAMLSGSLPADEPGASLPPQVPAVFGPVLGLEGRQHLQEAMQAGLPLYRARIAIGAPPEQEASLESWLREETQPITSRTVLQGPSPHLDMLLAAATPLPELLRRMERIDPAHRLMLSLEPLLPQSAERGAAAVTMRVRQDTVDGIIALEAEARAAALAVNEALYDDATQDALAGLGRLERRLSGGAARELMAALDTLRRTQEQLGRAENRLGMALRQLDEAVLELRVVPIGTLFARLPRVVRAVAEASGKDVEVVFEGKEVQIDRSLVELLADPLLHLVRNAVDHGIETPAQRRALGKPARATLRVAASRRLSQIRLEVSDDGRGIDHAAVLRRAVERGLVTAEAAPRLREAEIRAMLFTPGFSTAETVTETSGRGVGLDVVQDAARRAGGALEVVSELGLGTSFRLALPVTAAVQTVLLVEVGGHPYALPAARVEGVLDAAAATDCAVVPLATFLGLEREADAPGGLVLVRSAGRALGLQVDRVRRRTNLLLRPLHPGFAGLPAVAGLGVLGNGDPVVVLEPDALAPA